MSETGDPFDKLFSRDDIAEHQQAIADLLHRYVRLSQEAPHVHLTAPGHRLTNKQKILLYLLALSVLKHRNLVEDASAKPSAIADALDIPSGSVAPAVRELAKEGLARTSDSAYRANISRFDDIQALFGGGEA